MLLENERESTRSHSVEKSLYKRLWTAIRKTDYGMAEFLAGHKNYFHQVVRTNKFFNAAPSTCGSWVCKFLHVALLAPRVLRCLLDFWEVYEPLVFVILVSESFLTLVQIKFGAHSGFHPVRPFKQRFNLYLFFVPKLKTCVAVYSLAHTTSKCNS
jgi:hypothetical protein